MQKILIVCGPTATGKTALAATVAKTLSGELISADSRQVYRGMDIGTGKDRPAGVQVWLYDVVNPDEDFSVSQYAGLATQAIVEIEKRGKLPIVVGGTGLYIQSLIHPIETASIPPNKALRDELNALSLVDLQQRLEKEDPKTWEALNNSDRNNPRRLIRKIEIASSRLVIPASEPESKHYDVLMVGLTAPNEAFYTRIDARVEERVKQGVEQEIQTLLAAGYSWDLPSMNTLGYKEFKNGFTPEAIQTWKYDEHAYARRQKTWFAKQQGIHWYDITSEDWQQNVIDDVGTWYTNTQ